jgi:hypothetical protein
LFDKEKDCMVDESNESDMSEEGEQGNNFNKVAESYFQRMREWPGRRDGNFRKKVGPTVDLGLGPH